jgi:hypothetical protein
VQLPTGARCEASDDELMSHPYNVA